MIVTAHITAQPCEDWAEQKGVAMALCDELLEIYMEKLLGTNNKEEFRIILEELAGEVWSEACEVFHADMQEGRIAVRVNIDI
jgi:hypothetical protein